jgi:hypothetical protein
MIDMMENVFTDYSVVREIFLDPLIEVVKGVGASKDQVKSTSFCLHRLLLHMTEHMPAAVTEDLIAKLLETLTSGRITTAEYILMVRSIIRFLEFDISAFSVKPLFRHSIYAINCGTNNISKLKLGDSCSMQSMGHIPGK